MKFNNGYISVFNINDININISKLIPLFLGHKNNKIEDGIKIMIIRAQYRLSQKMGIFITHPIIKSNINNIQNEQIFIEMCKKRSKFANEYICMKLLLDNYSEYIINNIIYVRFIMIKLLY